MSSRAAFRVSPADFPVATVAELLIPASGFAGFSSAFKLAAVHPCITPPSYFTRQKSPPLQSMTPVLPSGSRTCCPTVHLVSADAGKPEALRAQTGSSSQIVSFGQPQAPQRIVQTPALEAPVPHG